MLGQPRRNSAYFVFSMLLTTPTPLPAFQPSKNREPLALDPGRSGNSRKDGLKVRVAYCRRVADLFLAADRRGLAVPRAGQFGRGSHSRCGSVVAHSGPDARADHQRLAEQMIEADGSAGCTASVSPADTPVSPADTANGVLRRTIRHILLSFKKLDSMAYILLFFWVEGHDKRRPKGTCFTYPTH